MEKFKVGVTPNADGTIPSDEELFDLIEKAGWSDDPGEGVTVLIPDERGKPGYEVFNPVPYAPPIGWEPTPPIDELIRQRVRDEYARLKDDEEIDDIVDAEDFDVEDEGIPAETLYEVMARDVPPMVTTEVKVEDRVKDQLDYEELVDRERRLRKLRSREEYERRRREEEALYGPSEAVREAIGRQDEGGGR